MREFKDHLFGFSQKGNRPGLPAPKKNYTVSEIKINIGGKDKQRDRSNDSHGFSEFDIY
jgi:hypothetical protein